MVVHDLDDLGYPHDLGNLQYTYISSTFHGNLDGF